MRVLHLMARMNLGGTARYLGQLANALNSDGVETLVVTGYVQDGEIEDPIVHELTKIKRIKTLGRKISPLNDAKAINELIEIVNEFRPDIIHSHTFKAGFIARFPQKRINQAAGKKVKYVHTFHGHQLTNPEFSGIKGIVLKLVEKNLAKKSDKLVAVGKLVAQDLASTGIGKIENYVNIPPGITALKKINQNEAREKLGLSKSELIFGYLGRLIPVKGPLRFVEVTKKFPKVAFALGGEGQLFEEIKREAPPNVKVLGWVNSSEFMSAINVLVATSDSEGIPVALIEAALAGVPVISTNVGSVSEVVINGKTGLVTSNDVNEIAGAINKFIDDPILITAYGTNAKRFAASEFSTAKMVERHKKLYKSVLATS
ncbi:MAG: hypothetical protein RLZ57_617 [Actinomycetota bacterium]